jgi:hypothetical protein
LKKFVSRVPNFEEVTNWVPNVERPSNWVPNFQISPPPRPTLARARFVYLEFDSPDRRQIRWPLTSIQPTSTSIRPAGARFAGHELDLHPWPCHRAVAQPAAQAPSCAAAQSLSRAGPSRTSPPPCRARARAPAPLRAPARSRSRAGLGRSSGSCTGSEWRDGDGSGACRDAGRNGGMAMGVEPAGMLARDRRGEDTQ